MKQYLQILLVFLFISCSQLGDKDYKFVFSISNQAELEKEIQGFIDSIQSATPNSTIEFQNDLINWWNVDYSGSIQGQPNVFEKNISLNQIKELDNLFMKELSISGDTIRGIINVNRWYFPNNALGINGKEYCLDTNYIELVIKKGKIREILNYEMVCSNCFWIDDSEVGEPYKEYIEPKFNQKQYDSIYKHQNDFSLK